MNNYPAGYMGPELIERINGLHGIAIIGRRQYHLAIIKD